MSTVIDQRVAELRFDNSHFEKNVSTTMSTLDKLKEKLNLTGASKGLSDIGTAAKKVDMSGLASGVETVRAKFSALEVMGVTALANITNSAVNAGKRIVKSLTIDPITTGWNEYELKMNSVQTIMASTGASIETVNKYLNELNEYSDKTIYSFSDMTQNIGKFTNAGVALEDAVMAMKGISNEAALSGANANEASRAMYNLSQAMSMGYVQYIDWKSIENANMATVSFKEQLIKTALALGTIQDAGDEMYTTLEGKSYSMMQMFKDGMKDQWLTSDVLISTLKEYADETTEIGAKAYEAATKVKTFSHMMDTLKEAAQSGWAQTWEIMFGDFEEGTTLWTGLNKVLGGIIDKMSDVRNALAKNVFYSNWEKLTDKVEKAGVSVEDFQEAIKEVAKENGIVVEDLVEEYGSLAKAITKGKVPAKVISTALKKLIGVQEDATEATEVMTGSLEEYEKIADQVINGVFGTGETRIKKLTDAGYDWAYVQNIVNERLGSSVRHITSLTEEQIKQADSLAKLNDETLKSKGYTDEQITALRDLQKAAEDSGSSINELINDLERPSGRELVIDAFSNAFEHFSKILGIVGEAWNEVFGDIDLGQSLYNVIEKVHEFTESLHVSEEQAKNFKDIITGIFSAFDLSWSLASASLMGGLKILNEVLKLFGTDLGKALGWVANQVTALNQWVEGIAFFGSTTKWTDFAEAIKAVIEGIRGCITAFTELERFQGVVEKVKAVLADIFTFDTDVNFLSIQYIVAQINKFFSNIENWIRGMDSTEDLGRYIIEGLYNGLVAGIQKVVDVMRTIAQALISVFKGEIDSHSPSKVFYALGTFIILGLINGIANGEGSVVEIIKGLASSIITAFEDVAKNGIPYIVTMFKTVAGKLLEFVGDLDLGTIIATGMGAGILTVVYKMVKVAEAFTNPFNKLAGLFGALTDTVEIFKDSITARLKAKKIQNIANLIKAMAIAIAALAASLWVISTIPEDKLWSSVKAVAALAAIVAALAGVATLLERLGGFSFSTISIIGFAASVLILSNALKKMSEIQDIGGVVNDLTTILIDLMFVFALMAFLTKGDMGINMGKAGLMFIGLSVAMLLLSTAMKRLADLDAGNVTKGLIVIGLLELFFIGLSAVAKTAGASISKAGGMLVKMSIALLLLVGVIKMIDMLDYSEIVKGIEVITALTMLFTGVMAISQFAGEHSGKAGWMFIGIAAALASAVLCMERVGKLNESEIKKGIAALTALEIMFGVLIGISKFSGQHAAKAGAMLLMVSGALLMLTGVIFILGSLDVGKIWSAVAVITVLEIFFGALIFLTQYVPATDGANNILLKLMITIGLLAAIVIGLSYIPTEKLAVATGALTAITGMFAMLIFVTQYLKTGEKTWKRNLATLLTLTVIITALAGVVTVMSNAIENPDSAIKAAASLGILLLSLSSALAIISTTKTMTKEKLERSMKALLVMSSVVAVLGIVLGTMSALNAEASISNAVALGILLNAMAVAFNVINKSKPPTKNIYNMIGAMAALGLVVGEMGLILGLLNKYDLNASMSDVLSLSAMIIVMAGVLSILNGGFTSSGNVYAAVGAMAALGLVVGEMGVILGLLNKYDMNASLGDVAALSIMLVAMTGVLVLLGATSAFTSTSFIGIGALAALGLVVGEMGLILGLLKKYDMMASVEDVKALSILLLAMSSSLVILSVVGLMGPAALVGCGILAAFIAEMGIILAALGGLYKIKGFQELIADGGKLLKTIGTAIGEFFGSFASGFTNEVMTSISNVIDRLPDIGTNLSTFMNNLSGFIEGAKQLSTESAVLDGVNNLVEIISKITTMTVKEGIATVMNFGSSSMDKFAEQLNSFGAAMVAFSKQLKEGGFDGTTVTAAASAGEMIATLYDVLPKTGGLLDSILGTSDLGHFATQLEQFGKAIVGFSDIVTRDGTSAVDDKAVKSAVKAGEMVAKLQDSLPETGGIIEKITGMKDLSLFGANLVSFGTAIVAFSDAVSSDGAIQQESIEAAKVAGETMAALQDSLPSCEGVFEFFGGKQNLATFGANIVAFGNAIVAFSSAVSAEGAVNQEAITAAHNMGMLMTEVQAAIPEDKWFDGKMSIEDFGKKLEKFGGSIATYSNKVSDIDASKISESTKAAKELVSIAQTAVNIDEDKMAVFSKIKTIGIAIKDYSIAVAKMDTEVVSASITAINKLITAINNMAGLDTSGVDSFKSAMTSLGETNIKGVVKAFSNSKDTFANVGVNLITSIAKGMQSKQSSLSTTALNIIGNVYRLITTKLSSFDHAGKALISKLAAGMSKGKSSVTSAIKSTLSSAVTTANGYYWSFYSAGTFLVDGFAAGITARTWKAAATSAAMANAAEQAAKEALDINSPSKVFRAIAYSIPEGFAMGIDKMSYLSTDAAYEMASRTISGVKDAIARISDYMNEDIDSQPTIRPVVDLSDVKTGMAAINGIFGQTQSIGVMSNVRSISSMMNQRNQNGANTDVVSAIDKLRKEMGNIGGNTYNSINGVNIGNDDGVAEAFETIIRAARIEGRS